MGSRDSVDALASIASVEAEQSVLGGLLLNNDAFDVVSDLLVSDDFTRNDHRIIYSAITALIAAQGVADAVTVYERLQSTAARIKEPLRYLNDLVQNTPSAANIRHYATIVRDRSLKRAMRRAAQEVIENIHQPAGRNAEELLDFAQSEFLKLSDVEGRAQDEFQSLSDALTRVVENVDKRFHNGAEIGGLATGFHGLDAATDGMHGGELIIVGGRPSMGKTSFAMNIGENVALEHRIPVAVISLEMPADQLAMRMLSGNAGINQQKLRSAKFCDEDWARLTRGVERLADAPLYILDGASVNPSRLRAKVKRLERQIKARIGLLIVDYLQLMDSDSDRQENRTIEMGEISRSLKRLAKELDVPVIALSQLNRGVEQRQNKRPVMADIRESGSIEQDADVILFIYRDEVYNPDSTDRGTAEIIIAKQRNGPLTTVPLAFRGNVTRFENLAEPEYRQ